MVKVWKIDWDTKSHARKGEISKRERGTNMADRTAEQGKTEGIDGSVRKDDESATTAAVQVVLPRVTIVYCTQCRWMLRAAYVGLLLLFFPLTCFILLALLSYFTLHCCSNFH